MFNVAGGVWPLVHMRSFEAALGPKIDRWLVYTVACLMTTIDAAELATNADSASVRQAQRIGVGCAAILAGIEARAGILRAAVAAGAA
jgi:uncharacterized membrane protein